jgi:hypothetical protein
MFDNMSDNTLIIITIFFLLSLLGAFILFRFLESAAIIKSKKYQAGGAIAGFIIIFVALGAYYLEVEKSKSECNKILVHYKELCDQSQETYINGTITPPTQKNVKIVLAVKEADPDSSGKFRLGAPCINIGEGETKLYVITEDSYSPLGIYSKDDLTPRYMQP